MLDIHNVMNESGGFLFFSLCWAGVVLEFSCMLTFTHALDFLGYVSITLQFFEVEVSDLSILL